jgi:hypothetical protein
MLSYPIKTRLSAIFFAESLNLVIPVERGSAAANFIIFANLHIDRTLL